MSCTLDAEALARLRVLEVASIRRELPTWEDFAWLVEQLYELDGVVEAVEKEQEKTEALVTETEAKLEDELQKNAVLIEECGKMANEVDDLRARAEVVSISFQQLMFLRRSLGTCVEALDKSMASDSLTRVIPPALVSGKAPRKRKR